MAAIHKNTGISVNISTSPVTHGDKWTATLKDAIASYDHHISSEHGFDSATIGFAVNRNDISGWLNRGVGMDVDVRGRAGTQIWNGFVDAIDVHEGARKVSIGRLSDIANRIIVMYAIVIEGADEPVIGEQTYTGYADDTDSQDKYGAWTKVISGGSRTEDEATQIRDTVLTRYAYPDTSYDISAAGTSTVTLKCSGYSKWLDAFVYNNSGNNEVTTSAKLLAVLATEASGNGVISTDYSKINTISDVFTQEYEDQNRTGLTVIKECVAFGDSSNNPWTFGIYEDRVAAFDVVPSTIEYVHKRGLGPVVERLSGGVIEPWLVRPAKWLFMPDAILGGADYPIPDTRDDFYKDLRIAFIDRVSYTAPYGLAIQGTRLLKGTQALARWGLGNI